MPTPGLSIGGGTDTPMKTTRRVFLTGAASAAASGLAPGVIRSSHAQGAGATIRIGMVLPVTGPGADAGRFALNGAKIALEAVNKAGGVLGKPLEIVTEDDQTTNPGAVLAFSKLASQPDLVGFLGSIRSTQNHAMAPDILKTGKPVMLRRHRPGADAAGQSRGCSASGPTTASRPG